MNKPEYALSLFNNGYSCAQSILVAFAQEAGINNEIAFRIAAGLGGGIGRTQNICGAINAGAIVIGMKLGRFKPNNSEAKDDVAQIVGKFVSECRDELGSTQCFELVKVDLNNPEQKKQAAESGHLSTVCNNAVFKSASILERYLDKNP